MPDCIFCKIAAKEIPADIVDEDEAFVSFKDIRPKAPIHILIVSKAHLASVNELEDAELAGRMIMKAKKIARDFGIAKGYKLVFNVGRDGGQVIDHIHLHLLGGWPKETHLVEV